MPRRIFRAPALAASLLVAALPTLPACAPEQEFDHVCDPIAPAFDPCGCRRLTDPCPLGTACRTNAAGEAECQCDTFWCPAEGPNRTCCSSAMVCVDGACRMPECGTRQCGHDRWGLPCGPLDGDCPCGHTCTGEQACVFTACDGPKPGDPARQCGSDGCGGSCGKEPGDLGCKAGCGIYCNEHRLCAFDPCHDRECGADPCSGANHCGTCTAAGASCTDGRCVP
jgi:hypothetical protein